MFADLSARDCRITPANFTRFSRRLVIAFLPTPRSDFFQILASPGALGLLRTPAEAPGRNMLMNFRHHGSFSLLAILSAFPWFSLRTLPRKPQKAPAGKITAVVPVVNVVRGTQQVAASSSSRFFGAM